VQQRWDKPIGSRQHKSRARKARSAIEGKLRFQGSGAQKQSQKYDQA
jgi:hypothetical protein